MISNFLQEEKINDELRGHVEGDSRLSLSLLLEIYTFKERRKLDALLFNEVVHHNINFKMK